MSTLPKDMKPFAIDYWDGINATVGPSVSKPQEPVFAENVRSNVVGVLETREGLKSIPNGAYDSVTTVSLEGAPSFVGVSNNPLVYRCGMFKISRTSAYGTLLQELLRTISSGNESWANPALNSSYLLELGNVTTEWNVTSPSGSTKRYTWNTVGTDPELLLKMSIGTTVTISGGTMTAANKGAKIVSAFTSTYFEVFDPTASNQTGATAGLILLPLTDFSGVEAEGSLFYTTKGRTPFQVDTVYDPIFSSRLDPLIRLTTDATASVADMPRGAHIEYYKSKLYVGNIRTSDGVEYPNSLSWSSDLVGFISMVDGDHATGVTKVKVTDTKYVKKTDSLDIIRGGAKIGTITVSAKTEDTLTVTATGFDIKSSDQIWVLNTFSTAKPIWRWDTNSPPGSPLNASSIQVGTNANSEITCLQTVGNMLVAGTRTSTSGWNGSSMTALSTDIGVVSHRGWVNLNDVLYFVSNRGVFRTAGGKPERISTPIRRIFDYSTKAGRENSVMWSMGDSIFAYVGTVTIPEDDNSTLKTITNCVFEFDTVQENWYLHSYASAIDEANNFNDQLNADDCLVAFNDSSSSVTNHFMYGSDDNGADIYWRIDTPHLYLNSAFEKPSYLWFAHEDILQGDGVKMFLTIDSYDPYEVDGQFSKGLNTLTLNGPPSDGQRGAPRSRKVKISFRSMTKKKIKLGRFRLDYSMSAEPMPEADQPSSYN